MARRKDSNPNQSLRWPVLFKDPDKAESLFSAEGWNQLLADLRGRKQELSDGIVHDIPHTPENVALQNFDRGCCSVAEDLLGLEEEYRKWKEQTK